MSRDVEARPVRLVVMGVAGSGKTTIGEAIAAQLSLPFVEGDSLHSAESVAKMSRGAALTDDDRWPWLDRIAKALHDADDGIVVSCSALKRTYRDRLRAGGGGSVAFLFLDVNPNLLSLRLNSRKGHFMKQNMLDSQLATLERPVDEPLVFFSRFPDSIDAIVDKTTAWLKQLSAT